MRRLLGSTGWTVWIALLWRRDSDGLTRVRNATLVDKKGISTHQMRRASEKLRRAGLVETVEASRGRVVRKILGDYRGSSVTIPKRIWPALMELAPHGGRRHGAGRKNQDATLSGANQDATLSFQDATLLPIKLPPFAALAVVQGVGMTDPIDVRTLPEIDHETYSGSSSEEEEPRRPAGRPPQNPSSGRARGPRNRDAFDRSETVPPFPDTRLLHCPRIPSPPTLDLDLPRVARVEALAKSYRGAVESRYKEPCFALTKGDIRVSRYFPLLAEAAVLLDELGIAPAAWAAWSVDVWKDRIQGNGKRHRPPPLEFVFSKAHISKRGGWFAREVSAYGGGKVVQGPRYQELVRLFDGYYRESFKTPETEHAALVERWFPGGWQGWYERAQREGDDKRRSMELMVESGEFLWDDVGGGGE